MGSKKHKKCLNKNVNFNDMICAGDVAAATAAPGTTAYTSSSSVLSASSVVLSIVTTVITGDNNDNDSNNSCCGNVDGIGIYHDDDNDDEDSDDDEDDDDDDDDDNNNNNTLDNVSCCNSGESIGEYSNSSSSSCGSSSSSSSGGSCASGFVGGSSGNRNTIKISGVYNNNYNYNIIFWFSFLILIRTNYARQSYDELHIGGIFPIAGKGGWQGGQACMPAARLALEDVNNVHNLLAGYKLILHSNDSECEPGLGASVMYNLLYNKPQKLMLLAGCSTVCTTVAEAAKMWNLIVLCYGASSPALSDRSRFPTLFRTHPSATVHNPTRIRIMKKFQWSKIAILQQTEEVFISTVEDLENRCKEGGIEIVTRQSFLSDPTDAVRNLRRQDARIIVGLFYVVAARRVLCEMYKQQLYGRAYVWFFIGWYEDNWYEVNLLSENISCSPEQMKIAAEGHLTTEALMWNQNSDKTISGMSSEDFRERLNLALMKEGYDIKNKRYPEGYQEAPLAYDAVWSVALAFNRTMEQLGNVKNRTLKDFTYNDREIANEIYAAMNATQFIGVSGFVAFSSQGDRIALTQIEQMINGAYIKLGYYDTQSDNLTWLDEELWAGGKQPQDRTIIERELRKVSLPLFVCMTTISSCGISVAIALIIFNMWNSHRRVIQSSHPVCNTIMLFGVIICLVSVILLGIDGRFVSPNLYPMVCQTRAWLLSIGFTLAYGAMFSKVWRVHRFTTKQKQDPKKKVEPWKLYTMVTVLLSIDIALLLSWQLFDPLQRRLEQFPLEDPISTDLDIKYRPELEHCESENNAIWLGLMYGFKGLILLFGLFLAYETRSIKVKQINDSRYVGMSIYNVVVLCLITAPVAMVIASQQDASFAFISLAVIFCCFLSMLLIFVPKVIEVIRHPMDKAESKYNPDVGVSKEEEERYQKCVSDNEELQRLIVQKEEKIRILRQRLNERDAVKGQTKISQNEIGIVPALAVTQEGYVHMSDGIVNKYLYLC